MHILIFGATGLIGSGVLHEALEDTSVTRVTSVGRRPSGIDHAKLEEIGHTDFTNFDDLSEQFRNVDACFWCLGISARGLDEARYTEITFGYTLAAARALKRSSPEASFCFLSGAGARDTEEGGMMWARVKGRTENALRPLGFSRLAIFRPAFIHDSLKASDFGTAVFSVVRGLGAGSSNRDIGKAMLRIARGDPSPKILTSKDVNTIARGGRATP